jgi:hypothetical protein
VNLLFNKHAAGKNNPDQVLGKIMG